LAEKDLKLALALGESTGVQLPLAEIALRDLAAGLGVPYTKE
jgi:3-hydroxyisobutyrate dehydrogenase-like beta-hydroxyacid dehydrogenase